MCCASPEVHGKDLIGIGLDVGNDPVGWSVITDLVDKWLEDCLKGNSEGSRHTCLPQKV